MPGELRDERRRVVAARVQQTCARAPDALIPVGVGLLRDPPGLRVRARLDENLRRPDNVPREGFVPRVQRPPAPDLTSAGRSSAAIGARSKQGTVQYRCIMVVALAFVARHCSDHHCCTVRMRDLSISGRSARLGSP
jgi:hypothetical protein